jgi:hypothetical protein
VSKSKKESEDAKPVADARPVAADVESQVSDGWLSWLLLAIFLIICLVAWYLVQRSSLRGAPDAPVGALRAGTWMDPAPGFRRLH